MFSLLQVFSPKKAPRIYDDYWGGRGSIRGVNIHNSSHICIPIHRLHKKMLFIRLTLYLQEIKNVQNPNLLPITIPAGIKEKELEGSARGGNQPKKREGRGKRRTTHDSLLLLLPDVFVHVIGITGTGIFEPIHRVAHDV